METIHYIVAKIDGDYALLVPMEEPQAGGNPVARALLPEEITEGCHLVWENLEYTILS
ncbi:MAG: chorismate--pyruvate lyase [Angelakisella sp.]|nr:chorismate--pyruvate lyase [Angelakisella sp.]